MGTHMAQAVFHFSVTSQINEQRDIERDNFCIIIRRNITKVSTVDTKNRGNDANSKNLNYLLNSCWYYHPHFQVGQTRDRENGVRNVADTHNLRNACKSFDYHIRGRYCFEVSCFLFFTF